MVKAHRLLNIDRSDFPKLGLLAPTFAITAACTVVLASLSKALFLSANPISLLPWMFLGSAGITALNSLIYVSLMRRYALETRFPAMLLIGAASLVGLRLAFPLEPSLVSILILLWCPAVGHLVVLQTWNVATSTLPTRQGKRLFPVLSATTTLGAALGGILVQLLLTWIGAEDLLVLATLLLCWPLLRVRAVIRKLERSAKISSAGGEPSHKPVAGSQPPPPPSEELDEDGGPEIVRALKSIARKPLLADLAIFVFLLQAASLIIDYQFSAELKPKFDKDQIASFLGTFYWSSNLVVLVLTLVATSRFVRLVGIGIALAASGIVIGTGSTVYVVAAVGGSLPVFWVIAATAFAERVAQYAFTKPAVQMVFMPLQTHGGERAKTLIDGVVYRLATATVAVMLLIATPDLASQFRLSPPAIVACLVVLYIGIRIGPHYRRAIFEALSARRLDATVTRYLRDGLDSGAIAEVTERLNSSKPRRILKALDIARELALPLPNDKLDKLAQHDNERIAQAALRTMDALGRSPTRKLLKRMLDPHRPPRMLRAIMQMLSERPASELEKLADIVRPLTGHADTGVASAACVFRIRAAGSGAIQSFDSEVAAPEEAANAASAGPPRLTGITRAGDFARELPELLDNPKREVRAEAIEQMGQLALPYFVEPLIACLTKADVREEALDALRRYGERTLPHLRDNLEDNALSQVARITLLRLVEGIANDEAVELLVKHCSSSDTTLRDHAVEALWRLGGDAQAPRPAAEGVQALIEAEIKRLETYSAIEMLLTGKLTRRRGLFAAELVAMQIGSERRALRLLGMLYDRDAMYRAFLHYRSSVQRARSNAIELLEQHITAASLRSFVALVERTEGKGGKLRPKSMIVKALVDKGSIEALLDEEPWLRKLWSWLSERDDVSPRELDWDDELDRLLQLTQIAVFEGVSGRQLLPMALAGQRAAVAAGERVFEADSEGRDVYWILDGEVKVEDGERVLASLQRHDCFGEMSALDGAPRCATLTAVSQATLLQLSPDDFQDAIDLNPQLLRGIIGVLTRRLRAAIS